MAFIMRFALAAAGLAFAAHAAAKVTFYQGEGYQGRSFTAQWQVDAFDRYGFNDRASSVVVTGSAEWEVCDDAQFRGRCVILRPGRYPTLGALGLDNRVSSARAVSANSRFDETRYAPFPVTPQVTFYENANFEGRAFPADTNINNFSRSGFNDRASSVIVEGVQWEVCSDAHFRGRCVVLRPGRYPSLDALNMRDRISSARIVGSATRIDDSRYAPTPVAHADYRRRHREKLYEANVTSVRAVLATPEQRCWVEREEISQDRSQANVPAAIAGAILGGILGHQVGGGRGKDLATAGGAVAGAAVGAQIGRNDGQTTATKDVRHCEDVPSQARPEYWDVTYDFRGQEHRVQMTAPPGSTVTVNRQGEPRV